MPTRRGFLQGYNAQVAVTSDDIIAAVDLTPSPNDMGSFVPMMTAAVTAAATLHEATGAPEHLIGVVLADAGYCSNSNLDAPGPDRLVAPVSLGSHGKSNVDGPVRDQAVTNLHVDRIDEHHRVDGARGRFCHSVIPSKTLSVMVEIVVFDTSDP